MIETARPPWDLRVLAPVLLVLVLGLAAYGPRAVKESVDSDFGRYYTAGSVAWHGGDIYYIYGDLEFKYLPVVAQVFSLLAGPSEALADALYGNPAPAERWTEKGADLLPGTPTDAGLRIGAAVWYALLCFSYLACIAMAIDLVRPTRLRETLVMGGVAILLTGRFFAMNIRLGQLNMFVMLWAVFGCWLVVRRRALAGGAAVAVATALKIIPGGILLWLVWRRNWRGAGAFCVVGLALLWLAPMLTWGPSEGLARTASWFRVRHAWVTDLPSRDAPGQSLPSMANRLLRKTSAVTQRHGRTLYINVADSPKLAKAAAVFLFALACLLAVTAWRGRLREPPTRAGLEVGLLFLLLLLVSPESRRAHFITGLVPAAALAGHALRHRAWGWTGPALLLAFVTWNLTSSGVWGYTEPYYYMNACGVVLLGALVLFFTARAALRGLPAGPSDTPDTPAPSTAGGVSP